MKPPIRSLAGLGLLAATRLFAGPTELTIDYDPQTVLEYPEGGLVGEANHAVSNYNNEIRQPVPQDPIRAEQHQQDIAYWKNKALAAKEALAKERARLESAKASRSALPFPECAQLPWGSSAKKVAELLAKRGAKPAPDTNTTRLAFRGGTFAGETVHLWECRFAGDKLYAVTLYFQRPNEGLELFREWNASLAQKYHIGDIARELAYPDGGVRVATGSFKTRSDEVSMMAAEARAMGELLTGKWRPTVQWSFADGNRIQLMLASANSVAIAYINGPLEREGMVTHEKARMDNSKDL